MPADPSRAVFLSYASEDADAARRICEALRGEGMEVWFDADGGLEHGDEWDAKIRKQIKECVLFIPIISANTQARDEGYFRLEWDLAAERARTIASGVPFILPVVIDETREPDALVPDRFRLVQWTRLPGGAVSPEVKARYRKLWSQRMGTGRSAAPPATEAGNDGSVRPRRGGRSDAASRRLVRWLAGVVGVAAVAFVLGWKWLHPRAPDARSLSTPGAASSEVADIVARVWKLVDNPGRGRADLEAADELCKRAAALDPTNAKVLAVWSQVDSWLVLLKFDDSPARREAGRTKAKHALQFAPGAFEPRLALACFQVREAGVRAPPENAAEIEATLRELLRERPAEPHALLALGMLQRFTGKSVESRQTFEELARNPDFAAAAWCEIAYMHFGAREFRAAEQAADASLARQPFFWNLAMKTQLALYWHGDLDAARATLDRLPREVLREDHGAEVALWVHLLRRDGQAMLQLLENTSREWISGPTPGPKAGYACVAYEFLGREQAAAVERTAALRVVERRLGETPNAVELLFWKACLLAAQGSRAEASRIFRQMEEMRGRRDLSLVGCVRFQQFDEAMEILEQWEKDPAALFTAAFVRHCWILDPLRSLPRFQALQARLDGSPRFSPRAPAAGTTPARAGEKSIAVLPFANLSPERENEFFADGIHEDVLTNLQSIRELRVVSRTSVMSYRGTNKKIPEIARELGVSYVLEGSVRRQGDRVRVGAQLIDARTDAPVWSPQPYERKLTDIFAIQSELAQAIAQALQAAISPEERSVLTERPTENLAAYELVLKAREMRERRGAEDRTLEELQLLQRAVELDPKYGVAYANLATAHAFAYFAYEASPYHRDNAQKMIEVATRLAPESADVVRARGDFYYWCFRDYAQAVVQYERFHQLRPSDSQFYNRIASIHRRAGRWRESLAAFRQLEELDPGNTRNQRDITILLAAGRRFDEAIAQQQRVIERLPEDYRLRFEQAYIYFLRDGSRRPMQEFFSRLSPAELNSADGVALRQRWALRCGDGDEALRLGRGAGGADSPQNATFITQYATDIAMVLAQKGRLGEATPWLAERGARLRAAIERSVLTPDAWAELGVVEALLGHREEALRCARHAVEQRPTIADALDGGNLRAWLALTYTWAGEKDAAISEYARLLQMPFGSIGGGGGQIIDTTVHVMKHDVRFAPLRGDPRFEALLDDPKNNQPLF